MPASPYRFFPERDVSLHDLNPPEQFLLWAMRIWVRMAMNPQKARDLMVRAFAQVGAPAGAPLFHRFMMALTSSAARRISVRCPRSFAVLEDECGLLEILILAQAGHDGPARQALCGYVGPEAAETVLAHIKVLMDACREGNITVRCFSSAANNTPALTRLSNQEMAASSSFGGRQDWSLHHQGNQTLH